MTKSTSVSKQLSIIASLTLFIISFALWVVYDLVIVYIRPQTTSIYLLFLAIPATSLMIFILFTRLTNSTLRRQGYRKPTTTKTAKCLLLSVIFNVIYILVYLFPGLSRGSLNYKGISTDPLVFSHRIASAILTSLATESIFRGYIFRNLVRNHGLFTSIYASSILFGLYQISIRDITGITLQNLIIYVLTRILPAFAAGLFLCFFFYKTGWSILGPATFRMGFQYFFDPLPIVSPIDSPAWWIALTFDMTSYVVFILILEFTVMEPRYLRRRYGLQK